MPRVHSKETKIGIIRQPKAIASASGNITCAGSTNIQWTNPGVEATNYKTMYYTAGSINLDSGLSVENTGLTSQNGIHYESERIFTDRYSNGGRLSFSALADLNTLAPHLVAAFQAVTEAAGTPYSKDIVGIGLTSVPDFYNNGGFLHTIAFDTELDTSATDFLLINALLETFTFSIDFNASGVGRLAQISGTWLGSKLDGSKTLSGSWGTSTPSFFNNTVTWTNNCAINAVAVPYIRRISVTVNNNVSIPARTAAGAPLNWQIAPEYTFSILCDATATSKSFFEDIHGGTVLNFSVQSADFVADTTGIKISSDTAVCTTQPTTYEGDYLALDLSGRFYSASAATPLTIELNDVIDWAY